MIVAELEAAIVPSSQRIVPLPPTAGPVQLPWLVVGNDASVVWEGSGSLISTVLAGFGPLLVTVIV